MSSIVPGFEYDIFISYRHNDNRSGWVTEFVNALQEELAATIKDPVTVYFDSNPHDGLSETHDVDESLKGKLKSVILIPILSQTYCDPKSFAWQHEFKAYKKMVSEDAFGLKVKLQNGNVASRILPVRIHELEAGDQQLLQDELGGVLRPVDFIYRSSGVARPLLYAEEDPKANLNHTYYRDQINKVARGIKELIVAMSSPSATGKVPDKQLQERVPSSWRKKITLAAIILIVLGVLLFSIFYFTGFKNEIREIDKSIAVLPFENMNNDREQDYFSNGIAEDILNHLVKISDLKVKSRTSTLQYKGTTKSVSEIGDELNVGNVVEGSVRKVGDKVRIVVQLIDAKTDLHLWSETYDRDFKDVLALQSEIAIEIAKALEARLTSSERKNIATTASHDITAYDYFLKAREIVNGSYFGIASDTTDLNNAMALVNQAILLDKNFGQVIALKGWIWYLRRTSGISEEIWTDSALYFSSRAVELDPSSPEGYLVRARVLGFVGKTEEAALAFKKAYEIAPNNPEAQNSYGRQLILFDRIEKGADLILKSIENQYQIQDPQYYARTGELLWAIGDLKGAERLFHKGKSLAPGSDDLIYFLYSLYETTHEYDKALDILKGANQKEVRIIDAIAETYTLKKDYASAIKYYEKYKEIESGFEDSTQSVPLRHRLAFAYSELGRKEEAKQLIHEQLQILDDMIAGKRGIGVWNNLGAAYYDRALCLAYLGKKQEAVASLNKGFDLGWRSDFYYHNDPLLANVRDYDPFKSFLKKADDFEAFKKEAFTHAFDRAKANKELKWMKDR